MVFKGDSVIRRLRFFAPQELKIDGLTTASGMCIVDVRSRKLEGIGVRVCSFEQSCGTPTFWASHVVDLDEMK